MSAMSSQITCVPIVYWTVCSGADQRKHQSSASLAFVRLIHQWPVNSPHKGTVMCKMFPFDDVIMPSFSRILAHLVGNYAPCPNPCLGSFALNDPAQYQFTCSPGHVISHNLIPHTYQPSCSIKAARWEMGQNSCPHLPLTSDLWLT